MSEPQEQTPNVTEVDRIQRDLRTLLVEVSVTAREAKALLTSVDADVETDVNADVDAEGPAPLAFDTMTFRMAESYSSADVQRLARVSRNAITSWTDANLITADIRETTGTGTPRRFSRINVIEAAVAAEMSSCGVTRHRLAGWLPSVRRGVSRRSRYLYCLGDGHCLFLSSDADLDYAINDQVGGYLINLRRLIIDIDRRIDDAAETDTASAT